ncbi:MAG TPA: ATP-binding protein, partial [Pseudonocardiaceae bacterium]
MPSVGGRLVGRQLELEIIGRQLGVLRAAKPPRGAGFVEIVGEPGIGKSRLLGQVAHVATGHGHTVVSGRATEFERCVPFGVVVEALDDHLAALNPPDQQRLCGERLGLLAKVFPALQAWRPRCGEQVRDAERYRLHRAVRALLEALAEPPGIVVLLDDLHWADPASIELLVHLVRHPPRAPVLVAVSYRI